jgi:hypothetical protein
MQVTLTEANLAGLESTRLDDLYAQLALADAGTAANIGAAMESLASVRASMLAGGATEAVSLGGLIDIGKRVFNRLWPAVKAIVCKIYEENGKDGPLKDWIEAAATAAASLLGIAGPVAVLVITIAAKVGLGMLCDANAPAQPA